MEWVRFLFGSPRRTGNTVVAVLGLALLNWMFPRLIEKLIGGLIQAVATALNPFVGFAVLFFVLYMGYRVILSPFLPGKRKK